MLVIDSRKNFPLFYHKKASEYKKNKIPGHS